MSNETKERENKVDTFLSDVEEALSKRLKNYRTLAQIVYVLYILALFSGITAIIGVVIPSIIGIIMVKKDIIARIPKIKATQKVFICHVN